MSDHRFLLIVILVVHLTALTFAAPDYARYDEARKQLLEIRGRCSNNQVCINKAVDLPQSETDIKNILEEVINQKWDNRICFGVVIENKMEVFSKQDTTDDKMRLAAYITYNLYEGMGLARKSADCSKRVVIFYSRRDSTLYTFATKDLMNAAQIRTASAAARPYFSSSILEGMRFLILAYIDTIKS